MLEFIKIQNYLSEYQPNKNTPQAQKMFDKGEFMVSWFINDNCNFSCNYCGHYNRKPVSPKYDIQHIAQSFDVFGDCGHIIITGGEPFLYPGFIDLCKLLTEKHYLSINTNLSQASIKDFAEQISHERIIMINAGVHYDYRIDNKIGMDNFIKLYKILSNKNFNVVGSYVIHPAKILQGIKNIQFLKQLGLTNISAKTYYGTYDGKNYPSAYTQMEIDLISSYMLQGLDMPEYLKYTCFKNKFCLTGKDFFSIEHTGEVLRCNTDKQSYGNLFEKTFIPSKTAEKCTQSTCICPYQGMVYSYK